MVEGYREYDEGQQTYQVYKFGKLAELINAPEPKGFSSEKGVGKDLIRNMFL